MRIDQLLREEKYWCKNAIAKDKEGKPLASLDTYYLCRYDKKGKIFYQEFRNEDLAYSYSLYGALIKCYNFDHRDSATEKIRVAIRKFKRNDIYIAKFNDNEHTTFADIKKVIQEAGV